MFYFIFMNCIDKSRCFPFYYLGKYIWGMGQNISIVSLLKVRQLGCTLKVQSFLFLHFLKTQATHSFLDAISSTSMYFYVLKEGTIVMATFEKRLVFSLVSVSPSLLFSTQPQNYFTHLSTTKTQISLKHPFSKIHNNKIVPRSPHSAPLVFVDLICAFFQTVS